MKRTLIAAAVAALVMPLVALAAHKPGHGKGQANPDLSIKADPNPVVFGRTVAISGKLRGSDNTGKTVDLEEDPFPFNGQFKKAGTATTDAQGDYSIQATPELHTQYRTVAKVTPEETSETLTVRVRKRITRSVDDRTPARGQMVTFSGIVRPAHDGMTVIIQRRRATGTWRRMATTTLQHEGGSGDQSSYSQAVQINRDGVWRTKVKADDDHLGNHSRRVRLNVP